MYAFHGTILKKNLFHYFIIISNPIFGTLGPPYTATNGKFIRRVQRVIKDQSVSFSAVKLNKGIIREAVNQLCNYCRGEKQKKTTIPTVLGQTAVMICT